MKVAFSDRFVIEDFLFAALIALPGLMIAVAGWLVVMPSANAEWRYRMHRRIRVLRRSMRIRIDAAFIILSGSIRSAFSNFGVRPEPPPAKPRHRRRAALGMGIILGGPTLFALLFLKETGIESFDENVQPADPVITALLHGEQLVPPPAMAPEIFITKEVEALRKDLGGASRDWQLLDHEFRQRLLTIYHLMSRMGYQMVLLEGYRSPGRQALLARLGPSVTNAGANQSYHQFGLAADSAFLVGGKVVISERDPWAMAGYRLYGQFAESVGLVWGGRWRMMDFGHVELRQYDIVRK